MSSKLYVGNLSFKMDDNDLMNLFAGIGAVKSAKIIQDRETNRSKGFGFVEMDTSEAAQDAIEQYDGKEIDGRTLRVNIARERTDRGGERDGRRDDRR